MRITCPCGEPFNVDDRMKGKIARCPACKKEHSIPNESEAVTAAAPQPGGKPRPRRADDPEMPSIRSSPSRSPLILLIALLAGGAFLFVLVLGGCFFGGFLFFGNARMAAIQPPDMVKVAMPMDAEMHQEEPARVIKGKKPPPAKKAEIAPKELGKLTHVKAMCFSPDGTRFATVQLIHDQGPARYALQIWDFKDGKQIIKLYQGNDEIRKPVFSPDGKQCACHYFHETKVKVWDIATGKEVATFSEKGLRFTDRLLSYSADGQSLFSATENRIYRMDLADRTIRLLERSTIDKEMRLACSPTAPILLVAAIHLHLVDPANGLLGQKMSVGRVEAMEFAGDGKTLALGLFESQITLLETDNWQECEVLQRDKTEGFVCYTDLHLSRNGQTLVAVPHFEGKELPPTRKLDVWDVRTKTRRALELDLFYYLALAPNGRTLAVGPPDGFLLFVDPTTGERKDLFP